MNSQILSCLVLTSLLKVLQLPPCSSNPQVYTDCNTFNCGIITGIRYPFRRNTDPPYCGHPGLELNCNQQNATTINISNMEYRVLDYDQTTQIMRIVREDLMESTCPNILVNTTLDNKLFDYVSNYMNLTFLYGCPNSNNNHYHFSCGYNEVYVLRGGQGPGGCNVSVVVPVMDMGLGESGDFTGLDRVMKEGFEVRLKMDMWACGECEASGGQCYGVNQPTSCLLGTQASWDPPRFPISGAPRGDNRSTNRLQIVLPVIGSILAAIAIGWLIFFCKKRRKRLRLADQSSKNENKYHETTPWNKGVTTTTDFTRSISSYSSTTEFGNQSTYFGVHVFNYRELEQATKNFDSSRELGDGGFGTVYYAKLPDGNEVAVKRLYENNLKRVEQFMNEIEILTRLHHPYLVKIYGCTSKRSRELLIVYEYISNGTVGDHLHGKQATSGVLSWPLRLNIAVQTAEALTYLHASDIIHRDVKTNNLLLDASLRVKVADFGLSRLFPNNVTHVSTAPQGTPGYVDPEYHQCYQLTDKSDVYSFGVVLVELISSLQAVDISRHRHDINLSNMAINKIQNGGLSELVDKRLGFETDSAVRRGITLVAELAFLCLQQEKDLRPSMKEVLNNLRGIQNEELNVQKAEVVDIIVDDDYLLNSNNPSPPSPHFMATK